MSDVDTPSRDLTLLAPKFRAAVERGIEQCELAGYPVKVNEAYRSQARQAWLYAQGRTRLTGKTVTNAPTSLTSWHGYGLAVDVTHATEAYWPFSKDASTNNEQWFAAIAAIFKQCGCSWGGDWKNPDPPHMQWGTCPASPSSTVRALMRDQGVVAVWTALKAT